MQWEDRVGRRLKLRDLHILLAVVQQGSMAKAASILAVSQPAVSKAVADMEHTFGVRLLDRTRRGVQPTAFGHALARRGLVIFDEVKQCVGELEFLADPRRGELRIATSESIAAGILPAIAQAMCRLYPGVVLHVGQTVLSDVQYEDLRSRRVDLWLGRVAEPFAHADLKADILFEDPVAIVAGQGSQFVRRRNLRLADLAGERWILPPPDSLAGALVSDLFRGEGIDVPDAAIRTLSLHLTSNLLATNQFVGTLPNSLLRFALVGRSLRRLRVALPAQERPVAIVSVKSRTPNPIARTFVECAHTVARRLARPAAARGADEI